ncbi:MAG: redoxin domain-containing protein [Planctomycetes bacterium]|nr:redoxin domain-containing protein [Planctomycetota bacterium]
MNKTGVFAPTILISLLFFWVVMADTVLALRPDPDAGLKLDIIRSNLGNIAKMNSADAGDYYEKALTDLRALIEEFSGTEEAQEALFYVGATYNEMGDYEKAISNFDKILKQGEITDNFKARLLFFKAKALLKSGKIEEAREVVAALKVVEPRAANAFGRELSGRLRIGMEAPDFNVKDYEGGPLSLSQYKGNVVVLDFWATWSDHCLQEFSKVKKVHRLYKDKGVQFIGISLDDNLDDLKSFVGINNIGWPQVFEGMRWKGMVSKLFNVEKIPVMFVLDKESKIRYIGSDKKKVASIITKLLAKQRDSSAY